jgi:hypothetical protein
VTGPFISYLRQNCSRVKFGDQLGEGLEPLLRIHRPREFSFRLTRPIFA